MGVFRFAVFNGCLELLAAVWILSVWLGVVGCFVLLVWIWVDFV